MKAAGVQPNVVAYASLARPFAHRGEWQEARGASFSKTTLGIDKMTALYKKADGFLKSGARWANVPFLAY